MSKRWNLLLAATVTLAAAACGKTDDVRPAPYQTSASSNLHEVPGPPGQNDPATAAYATAFNFAHATAQREGWTNVQIAMGYPQFSDGNAFPFRVTCNELAAAGPSGTRYWYNYTYYYDRDPVHDGSGYEYSVDPEWGQPGPN